MSGMPAFSVYSVTDPTISDITSETDYGVLNGPLNGPLYQLQQTAVVTAPSASS